MATTRLAPDFKEFLQLLRSAKIEYLLIGGYTVGHYGFPQTVEMDGVEVDVIGLADLKANERASGRHQDLNDLEKLP